MSRDIATGHDQGGPDDDAPWVETDDARRERLKARLKAACRELRQDFDSVQIICTKHEDIGPDEGETSVSYWGSGNWYARCASTEECLEAMRDMFNGGGPSAEGDET